MKAARPLPAKLLPLTAAETEFLPAALEIVETPASPVGRLIGATIVALIVFALVWASLSRIDIVASATGRIVPADGTKVVQPFEAAIVRAIHARDGQRVAAGEVLVELDPSINQAERDHAQADLSAAQLEVARLRASLSDVPDPLTAFRPPSGADEAKVTVQKGYLVGQMAEYRAKVQAIDRQQDQKKAERDTIQAAIEKLSAIIPIVQQRVEIRRTSSDKQYTSRFQYFEMLQQLVEQQQELNVQRSRLRETEAALATLAETRAQAIAEFQRTQFSQLVDAERKADGLAHDVARSQRKIDAQYLVSPINGVVQQLAIHTVGGIVTPAQPLLAVVPVESGIEIEAMVSNRDVGFVRAGQKAEIKIDTFAFTRYGLLQGEVLSVSRDAVARDKPLDRSPDKSAGSDNGSSEPKGQELNFVARVSLPRSSMQIDERSIDLTPGMAVTVEIKTGSRSVMSYLLSPLLKYGQESLRER